MNKETASNPSDVPVFTESFSDTSKNAWQYGPTHFDVTLLDDHRNTGLFTNQRWRAGPILFGQRALDSSMIWRDKRHISVSGDVLQAHRYLEGYAHGRMGEDPIRTRPGAVAIMDWARPFEAMQTPNVMQNVYIPHAVIGYDPDQHPGAIAFEPNTTMGKVLHSELDHFYGQFLDGITQVSIARVKRLLSCLQVAFTGGRTHEGIRAEARQALGDVIRAFVETNLKSPKLNAATILRQFGVSRATLYRIFEFEGGVRKYIEDRRLFNAVLQISETPMSRGRMTRTAEEWGYSSYIMFNRAVRRQFGVPPKSLFQSLANPRGKTGKRDAETVH
ncbi:MAG: AraC family transcriptional regulator [Pseudomonadota bacterium]